MSDCDEAFDPREFLPYLLNQRGGGQQPRVSEIYSARYGMLRTDWRVMFHLGLFGPMTASEIGTCADIHKTKISRAVARLEERRFLTRTREAADRRRETLALTAAGRAAFEDLRATARQTDAALTEGIAPEDAARLRAVLRRLAGIG